VILKEDFIPEYEILVSNPALIKSIGYKPKADFHKLADIMLDSYSLSSGDFVLK
jgi:GDP-D-mannose dehydratase